MGSEAESDPYTLPKLPLFSMTPHLSEPSGTLTPPLQTSASVPFQWEEQPGKPRPCTDLIIASTCNRSLDLPPRLAILESNIITKTSSPITVLDGPGGKSVFSSSSFRFAKERRRRGQMQGSFDSNCSGGWSPNDDNYGGQKPDDKIDQQNNVGRGNRQFGSFRLKSICHKPKGSSVIAPSSSSTTDTGFSDDKIGRNSSLSKVSRSQFWATIYEGFKHVVPWRKKTKKESFIL